MSSRRRALLALAAAIGSTVAVTVIVGQIAHFDRVGASLDAAEWPWYVACAGGILLSYVGYIAAYRDLARAERGPRLPISVATRVVALKFGAFLVGASAGVLAFDYWALRRAGAGSRDGARRVLALGTLEAGCLAGAATVCAAVALAGSDWHVPFGMAVGWLAGAPAVWALAAWVSGRAPAGPGAGRPHRGGLVRAALGRLRAGFAVAVGALALLRRVLARPRAFKGAAGGFVLYWAAQLATLEFALHAYGATLGLPALVLALATAYLAQTLPIPGGGGGGPLVVTLHAVGLPLGVALLASLTYRIFSFWLPMLGAVLLLPLLPRLRRALAETAERTRQDARHRRRGRRPPPGRRSRRGGPSSSPMPS